MRKDLHITLGIQGSDESHPEIRLVEDLRYVKILILHRLHETFLLEHLFEFVFALI